MATSASTSADARRAALRIVVLASGRGSNLAALIDAERRGAFDARIVSVYSDKADAPALERARAAGIAAHALDPRAYPERADFDRALFAQIAHDAPDLIVLAGFMRVLDAGVVARFAGRMINIHPSLLPKYPGLHTHRRALAAGDRRHGASVHYVTADLDGGPLLAQAVLDIGTDESEQSLAARLLPLEHALLVATVRLLAEGRLRPGVAMPELDGCALAAPLQLRADGTLVRATG